MRTTVPQDGSSQADAAETCKTLLAADPSTPTGWYWVDPNGGTTSDAYRTWCDMDTDGGWTVLVHNAADVAEPNGCVPRVGSSSTFVCGSAAEDQDFVVDARGFPFSEVVWVAYENTWGNATAYQHMTFSGTQTIPDNAGKWFVQPTSTNNTISRWSSVGKFACTYYAAAGRVRAFGNAPSLTGSYGTSTVTLMTDAADLTTGRLSFTDYGVSTYQSVGLDDFQDGYGCSDSWAPQAARGDSSYIMFR